MNTWTILADGSAQSSDGTTMSAEQVQEFAAKYLEWYGEPPKNDRIPHHTERYTPKQNRSKMGLGALHP